MCYKRLLFFFLFFSVFFFSKSKLIAQQKSDSIVYFTKKAKGKLKLIYLKKAVDLAKETEIDSLIKQTNIKFGIQSYFKKDTLGLVISSGNLLKLYDKTLDSFTLAKYHHYKALIHLLNLNKDSSFYHYHQSKNISIKLGDSLEVGRRLLSMANMQRDERDYLGSEITSIEGLRFLEPLKEHKYTGNFYNNIGLVLSETNRNKEAIEYFEKSKVVNKKNPHKVRKEIANLNLLNNIGRSYYRLKKYKKSINYFTKVLSFENVKKKHPYHYNRTLVNLSYSKFKIGEKEEALKGYLEVLEAREKINDEFGLADIHTVLSGFYLDNNKKKYHAKKGLGYATKLKLNRRVLSCLKRLTEVSKADEYRIYFRKYIELNNQLFQRERNLKNQFAKIRYETDKKEKENIILKKENEKKKLQLDKEKQQKTIGFLISAGSLLLLVISIVVFRNRRKKLTFEAQLQKAEVREEERKQIAKSLHDEVAGDIRVIHQQLEKNNQLEIAENLDKVKNTVRNLSHQLSSVSFEGVSFKDQIINLLSDYYSSTFKIKVNGINDVNWNAIKSPIKRTFFLSVRECIQNSVKYANATTMNIAFSTQKNSLQLCITDNGSGFDPNQKKKGIGLVNLKVRVEELNGKLFTESNQNEGTKIIIEIPLNA